MSSPRRKPGFRHWKRVPGVVRRVHRTPAEWSEIMDRFRARGQSKSEFCEQNAIAHSTFILWEAVGWRRATTAPRRGAPAIGLGRRLWKWRASRSAIWTTK